MKSKVYIGSISISDYLSFGEETFFDLKDKDGSPYQWTVILGNNNTGKTNFLKAIANLNPTLSNSIDLNQSVFIPLGSLASGWENNGSIDAHLNIYKNQSSVFEKSAYEKSSEGLNWGFSKNNFVVGERFLNNNFRIYAYGTNRRSGETNLSSSSAKDLETLFNSKTPLINIEEWLLQLDYASKNNDNIAKDRLSKLIRLIKSEVFPEIFDVDFISKEGNNYIKFKTFDGWVRISELGYGYQTTLAWIFDLSKKMFTRYNDSPNPLKEPAVVLIDELDLHLHPNWQREIIKYLSDVFSQTQFIVTTHSPFIIQSLEKINLFILKRDGDKVTVDRPAYETFKGWTIEQILEEIHGLGKKTKSDAYIGLMNRFDQALDEDNYEQAKAAYDELSKILHPSSEERKLLKIQLSQLIPDDKA